MAAEFLDRAIFFFTEIYSTVIIKIVVALIIILIGFIVGKIVGKIAYKLLNEINLNNFFHKATGLNFKPDLIISKGITYLIDFFVIIIAVDSSFTPTLIYIISASIIVIIVFSIIIGIKDLIPNVIAGLSLYRKSNFNIGDRIEINNHKGMIDKITLIETIIKKKNGDLLYIPNTELIRVKVLKKSN